MNKALGIILALLMTSVFLMGFGCTSQAPVSPTPTTTPTLTPTSTPTQPSPSPTLTPSPSISPTATSTPVQAKAYKDLKLPKTISMGTHGVGSSGFVMSAGLAEAVKTVTGMEIRLVPLPKDSEKVAALKDGSIDVTLWAISSAYFPLMGGPPFEQMGPQDYRMVWYSDQWYMGMATRADSGLKEIKDLKGKRVTYPAGSPGYLMAHSSWLAFGGLTYDDVIKVPVPSYEAGWDAVISGQADACYGGTGAPKALELESGIHGLYWFPMPHKDEEGWKRILQVGPFYKKAIADVGAGVSKEHPVEMAQAGNIITVTPNLSNDVAYALTRVFAEEKAKYVSAIPVEFEKWTLKGAVTGLPATMPYHPGSIQYFKDIGAWTPEAEAWQQEMLKQNTARLSKK